MPEQSPCLVNASQSDIKAHAFSQTPNGLYFAKQHVKWDSRQKAREKHPFTSPHPDYFPRVQLGPSPRSESHVHLFCGWIFFRGCQPLFPGRQLGVRGPEVGMPSTGVFLLSHPRNDPSAGEIQQARDQVLYNEPMPGAWLCHETGCPGDQSCPDPGHLSD